MSDAAVLALFLGGSTLFVLVFAVVMLRIVRRQGMERPRHGPTTSDRSVQMPPSNTL